MARIIRTHEVDLSALDDFTRSQVYNGLDVCVTHDVHSAIAPQLDEVTARTYALSRALQAPVIEMKIRGVLVDAVRKAEVITELFTTQLALEQSLSRIIHDGVGLDSFNWRSHADLQHLFYTTIGIPPIFKMGRPTVDRAAREKLELYPIATQLIRHINALTELGDKISVLRTAIDPDGRIRTSYNIAGTSTGRFSSSLSEFGTGGNLQNVEESLRSIFIADPGYKFAKADAKSGESFCVGAIEWNLFGDGAYLDAVESGDIHVAVARTVWPDLGWTGRVREDKVIASRPFHRHLSYRDMCKKLGHGSSYGGKPDTLSEQSRVPIDLVARFQHEYFKAFPAHLRWQTDVANQLRRVGHITTLTGRKRCFFGRRTDPATIREAIAYNPQGSLADIVNTVMLNIWRTRRVHIVMHDHDALTFMYPEEMEDELVPWLRDNLVVPVPLADGRVLEIPYDIEVGWNKAHASVSNPDGLVLYTGPDARQRQPIRNLLDHILGTAS